MSKGKVRKKKLRLLLQPPATAVSIAVKATHEACWSALTLSLSSVSFSSLAKGFSDLFSFQKFLAVCLIHVLPLVEELLVDVGPSTCKGSEPTTRGQKCLKEK